jgi:hypothetical protein
MAEFATAVLANVFVSATSERPVNVRSYRPITLKVGQFQRVYDFLSATYKLQSV